MVRKHPVAITLLVFFASLLLVRPFGNYPLNDDWQYAWVSWQMAKTGRFHVDVPIAPSLVLQATLASVLIRVVGFSHIALRALTWVFCGLFFLIIDRILRELEVRRGIRLATLLLLCFNPLFFNLGNSFMTEIYGNALGFLGVWIWVRSRRRSEASGSLTALSWTGALGAGAVFGAVFWIRQLVVLLLPCLVVATITNIALKRGLKSIRPATPRIVASVSLGALIALAYFPWAHWTGNLMGEFTGPLAQMLSFTWENHLLGLSAMLFYMTAFLFPFLLFFSVREFSSRRTLYLGAALLMFAVAGVYMFQEMASPAAGVAAYLHPRFPFLGNVIFDTGLGPLTLADTYWEVEPAGILRPTWGVNAWWGITVILGLLIPLWAVVTRQLGEQLRAHKGALSAEVGLFGFLVPWIVTAIMIQAYETHLFDRYLFTGFVALLIGLSAILDRRLDRKREFRGLAFGALLLPLAFFSIAGLHDYFRWNDARWKIVNSGAASAPWELLGGHEPWNWLIRTRWAGIPFHGQDYHRFQIVMKPSPGYTVLESVHVEGWLAKIPDVILEERLEERSPAPSEPEDVGKSKQSPQ